MTGYCLDTDVISAVLKPAPPLHLIRRLAVMTGNVRHFARVPGLTVENWLEEP